MGKDRAVKLTGPVTADPPRDGLLVPERHPAGVQGPAGQVFASAGLVANAAPRGDSSSPAPRRVAGPGFWQVQRPAGERRPGPGGVDQSAMFGRGRCVTG